MGRNDGRCSEAGGGFQRAWPFVWLLLWLFGCAFSRTAGAHSQLQNSLWVLLDPDGLRVGVSVTEKEIAVVQGGEPGALDAERVRQHADYVREHLFFEADGRSLAGEFERVNPPPAEADVEHRAHVFEFRYRAPGLRAVQVRHRMLEEHPYGPGQAWDVSYVIRFKRAGEETVVSELLRTGAAVALPPVSVPVGGWGGGGMFLKYWDSGVWHILTGYDHLLFVSGLVLGAVGFWAVVRVVGCFTLAHTVTLGLATLGWVRLPGWLVEPCIAASIVVVGVQNCLRSRQSAGRYGVAFGFGLLHGLGFAGGLMEAMSGLPGASMGLALLAFSGGVETGHLLVVTPLFLALQIPGRTVSAVGPPPFWIRAASALVAVAGAVYLVRALFPGAGGTG